MVRFIFRRSHWRLGQSALRHPWRLIDPIDPESVSWHFFLNYCLWNINTKISVLAKDRRLDWIWNCVYLLVSLISFSILSESKTNKQVTYFPVLVFTVRKWFLLSLSVCNDVIIHFFQCLCLQRRNNVNLFQFQCYWRRHYISLFQFQSYLQRHYASLFQFQSYLQSHYINSFQFQCLRRHYINSFQFQCLRRHYVN